MTHIPRVLVLNPFASRRDEAGGTRHIELFSQLERWSFLIISSSRNRKTGKRRSPASEGFITVPVSRELGSGASRILNWASYALSASAKGMRVGRVDVVYGSSPHLLVGFAAWLISSVKKAEFIFEVRDLWPKVLVDMNRVSERSILYRSLKSLETFLYRRASIIIVMAEGTRKELLSRDIPASKIVYIPNAADPKDFMPSAPRSILRQRYGFTRTTALYAGAHGPANGLHLLLDAARHQPNIDIVLVGGGVYKERLQASAREMDLQNVRFFDPVPKSEIPDLLAAADIGLHVLDDVELFRTSVSPNKLFDYMAAGRVVLTNTPGLVSDLVNEAGAGVTVGPKELSDGLTRLMALSEQDRKSMEMAGREWIGEHQSRRAMASRLQSVLDGCLDVSRRNAFRA